MERFLRAAWLAAAAGCSDPGGGPGGADAGGCAAPVAEFCDAACPDYEASVAEVMRLATIGRCFIAESGGCGAYRYTAHSTGFFGFTAWFTAAGELVAARRFEDTPAFCDETSYDQFFGSPPECALVATARYCPR
jgi:hypothetical protein